MNKKKLLAFVCSVCPFCIAARKFPNSGFARKLRAAEANCPACNAYKELHGTESALGETGEPPRPPA